MDIIELEDTIRDFGWQIAYSKGNSGDYTAAAYKGGHAISVTTDVEDGDNPDVIRQQLLFTLYGQVLHVQSTEDYANEEEDNLYEDVYEDLVYLSDSFGIIAGRLASGSDGLQEVLAALGEHANDLADLIHAIVGYLDRSS